MRNRAAAICVVVLAAMLGGCASAWEQNFQPNPELAAEKFPPAQSVQIRTVPFERLQNYTADEHQRSVQSTTAPEDLSPQEKLAAKNRLLEALQLKERDDQIMVLGWSEFADTQQLSPDDSRLQNFAKKIGADIVVVATQYAGKVTQTIERPMTTYSNSYATVTGPRGQRRRGYAASYSETSTTWVPVNVVEDQYLYTAAFLRLTRDDQTQMK